MIEGPLGQDPDLGSRARPGVPGAAEGNREVLHPIVPLVVIGIALVIITPELGNRQVTECKLTHLFLTMFQSAEKRQEPWRTRGSPAQQTEGRLAWKRNEPGPAMVRGQEIASPFPD